MVGWRGTDGKLCIANVFCPHLGAKLTPDAGGSIRNGHLVCPFHGFTYDSSGICIATPLATPNLACRLKVFPTEEINGFVFAYFDESGRAPDWRLPSIDETGWTRTLTHVYSLKTHPQETSENVIDLSHLSVLHGFDEVGHSGKAEIDGPCFKTDFRFDGNYNFPFLWGMRTELSALVEIWGLGFLFVETVSKALGSRTLNWFLATPVDGENVDILVSAKVQALDASGIKADGDIFRFRHYCKQFYPDRSEVHKGTELNSVPGWSGVHEGTDLKSVPGRSEVEKGTDLKSVPGRSGVHEGTDLKSVPASSDHR